MLLPCNKGKSWRGVHRLPLRGRVHHSVIANAERGVFKLLVIQFRNRLKGYKQSDKPKI